MYGKNVNLQLFDNKMQYLWCTDRKTIWILLHALSLVLIIPLLIISLIIWQLFIILALDLVFVAFTLVNIVIASVDNRQAVPAVKAVVGIEYIGGKNYNLYINGIPYLTNAKQYTICEYWSSTSLYINVKNLDIDGTKKYAAISINKSEMYNAKKELKSIGLHIRYIDDEPSNSSNYSD